MKNQVLFFEPQVLIRKMLQLQKTPKQRKCKKIVVARNGVTWSKSSLKLKLKKKKLKLKSLNPQKYFGISLAHIKDLSLKQAA